MKEQGKLEAMAIMQSKDRLRHYAERPFLRPELPHRTHLGYVEFNAAVQELLAELHIDDVPGDAQMRMMFDKFGGGGGDSAPNTVGVCKEDFEAMLFRLLTFMLAQGDVSVTPGSGSSGAVQERDKNWREEFLQKNRRRFEDVYAKGRKLGEGTFGAVFEVAHRTHATSGGAPVLRVCKVLSKAHAEKMKTPHARIREEFAVLKRLDHPHVVRIFEDFEDDRHFYLVMEPCRGGDLQERVKAPHTRDAREWEHWVAMVLQHTLSAVAYCHGKGVIHKDLKPENVMMASPKDAPTQDLHVVVVDFGLAQMFSSPTDRGTEIAGTPPFMAPEVWAGSFGKGCDVWSCGVMLFFMLSGAYPFMASRIEDFPKAVAVEPCWEHISGASFEAQMICNAMLCKKDAERRSASDLLGDRWFECHGLSSSAAPGRAVGVAMRGLLQVRERSNFERFVSRLVATQLDAGQQRMINEAFRSFDADKDGLLSRDELHRGLLKLGANPEEARQVVDGLDVGRTGRISYTEFLAGVMDLRSMSPQERDQRLWLVWQQFCPDAEGMVTTGDVQAALAARGMTVAEMPQAFLRQLRRGSSGKMSFQDFKNLFQGDESCCIMSSFVLGGGKADAGGSHGTK